MLFKFYILADILIEVNFNNYFEPLSQINLFDHSIVIWPK